MDEPTIDLPGARWGHLRWLLLLLLLAAGMRAWQLTHTEVATRDSIAYIGFAWRLQNEPWTEVLRSCEHHPVYPVLIHLASGPVRQAIPDDLPRAMQLAAQLVSCIAGVLLVVPMYWLGCELFDRRVGFWAALLFQCLPGPGRVMPDGLTEPVFFLLTASALLFACKAVRTAHPAWCALAGLFSGLAYLTRAEGLLVAGVTGLVLLGLQTGTTWRRSWPVLRRAGLVLTLATLVVAGPYMALIHGLTPKPSAVRMLDPSKDPLTAPPSEKAGLVHAPLPLAIWWIGPGVKAEDRYGWAFYALALMISKGFFHVLTLPAALGLWLFRRRFARVPGLWVLLGLGAVLMALLYRLGQSNGYVGERHVLLLVLGGLYWAVAALGVLAGSLAWAIRRGAAPAWALVLLVAVAVLPLPRTLARLHSERAGFRAAGRWLAKIVQPDDLILDPFGWTKYYAGGFFAPNPPPGAGCCYVVLEKSKNKHPHLWYLLEAAEQLKEKGKPAYYLEVPRGKDTATILIYRVPPSGVIALAAMSRR
jgi:hypothetical protein